MKATPCEEVDLLFRCDECGQELWCPEGAVGHKFRCPACARMDFVPPKRERDSRPTRAGGRAVPVFGAGGMLQPVFGKARLTIKRSAPTVHSVEIERHDWKGPFPAAEEKFSNGGGEEAGTCSEAGDAADRRADERSGPAATPIGAPAGDERPFASAEEPEPGDGTGRDLLEALVDCGFNVEAIELLAIPD